MAKRNKATDDLPKAKLNKENLKKASRIFKYVKPFRGQFILGMLFLLLTAATAMGFVFLISDLINSGNTTLENIDSTAIKLIILLALQSIFSYFRVYFFTYTTENMLRTIRQTVYQNLIKLPMIFFNENRVGEINSRISADIAQIQDTFTTNLAEFLRQLLIIIAGTVALFLISSKLAFALLATLPVITAIAVFFGRYIRKYSKDVQERVAKSNGIVEETVQGIANVKAFTNELYEQIRFNKSTDDIKSLAIKAGKLRGVFFTFIILCLFGVIVFLIWYAARLKFEGVLTADEMIDFLFLTIFVGGSIGGIPAQYSQIQKTIGATERVFELLDETAEALSDEERFEKTIKGKIDFKSIGFAYPGRKEVDVLKDVSFKADQGETVALVGSSGAGKSTIASLLLRFYDPTRGEILIDGKNANAYPLTELRGQMAIVPQDVLLFGGSIFDNILYGRPTATKEEVEEAARKANAAEFITGFPEGYETIVGDRGIKLSGGQRQRIAIARAVLKDPAILILDEATSSLDSESEQLVQEALEKLMKDRTSIVIAHRLATIRNADKIVVIDKGTVREVGTHEELILQEDGLYKKLSALQFELGSRLS